MKDEMFMRKEMTDCQIRKRLGFKPEVLKAFETVPRHFFVPDHLKAVAYEDRPLPIGCQQTISQPYMAALMTEILEVEKYHSVLEIGTGSGYQSAILSVLTDHVISIERIPELAEYARKNLKKCGIGNVEVINADGTVDLPENYFFDRVIVTAGAPSLPEVLGKRLNENGILVIPEGGLSVQTLKRYQKKQGRLESENYGVCCFVKLIGVQGWHD